jgi:hypothetical protein
VARYLLYHLGVDSEWLLKGGSLFLAQEVDGGAAVHSVTGVLDQVLKGAEKGTLPGLDALPADDELAEEQLRVIDAQAWDSVRYLTLVHGEDDLLALLRAQGAGRTVDDALRETLGQGVAEFSAAWEASLAYAHAIPEWLQVGEQFDPTRANEHVTYLSGLELAGRQAGSPGAASAASYVGERFAEYGLLPSGDASLSTYEQRFPISYTVLLEAPQIEFLGGDGQVLRALTYRQDFVSVLHRVPGWGEAHGELVWVRDQTYQGLDLGGKIAIRVPSASIEQEAAQAMRHGAGGLLIVGKTAGQKRPQAKYALPVTFPVTKTIPVLELTRQGYDQLLDLPGQTRDGMDAAPPALPLGVYARLQVPLEEPKTVETVNVLGMLPGSDPLLRDEVILLSAHYDHVGDDPDSWACPPGVSASAGAQEGACERVAGRRYPGANDNATGVGVLLEIARLWQESGYRPRRSVVFCAWGAHEAGQAGLAYYVEHPVWPFEDVVSVLHLEAVGGGKGYYLGAQGTREQEGLERFVMQTAEDVLEGRLTIASPPRGQDDPAVLFRQTGTPTLWLSWRESSEENWPDGLADEVEPYRLGVTGRMVTLAAMCLTR